MDFKIVPYTKNYIQEWNDFIVSSRLPLFLFNRNFMDYHSDRFIDNSLLFLNQKNKIIALFPCNKVGNKLFSHQGLTFGGFIFDKKIKYPAVSAIYDLFINYCTQIDISSVEIKIAPWYLHKISSEELLYKLYLSGAKTSKKELSSLVDLKNVPKFSDSRKCSANKAKKIKAELLKDVSVNDIYHLLEEALSHHGSKPVHSMEELILLKKRFPNNIIIKSIFANNSYQAVAILFLYGQTIHTQYLASSKEGKLNGALDFLIISIINEFRNDFRFLSFGISTEDNGNYLNKGLLFYKESFGGYGVCNETIELFIS